MFHRALTWCCVASSHHCMWASEPMR